MLARGFALGFSKLNTVTRQEDSHLCASLDWRVCVEAVVLSAGAHVLVMQGRVGLHQVTDHVVSSRCDSRVLTSFMGCSLETVEFHYLYGVFVRIYEAGEFGLRSLNFSAAQLISGKSPRHHSGCGH